MRLCSELHLQLKGFDFGIGFSKIYIAELEETISRGELTNSEAIAKINEFINETKKDGKPRWEKIYGNNISQISDLEDMLITKGTTWSAGATKRS